MTTKIDSRVLQFGEKHLETILTLDAAIGGSGFYGDPITREIADSFALGQQFLEENSEMWNDSLAMEIREKADRGEDTSELRKQFVSEHNLIGNTGRLVEVAQRIKNPFQSQVRYDQAIALDEVASVILRDLGIMKFPLDYRRSVEVITGITPALIPTRDDMDMMKTEVLKLMGYGGNASLAVAAAEWRKGVGLLEKDEMGKVYVRSCLAMLNILKNHGMPDEAELKVDTLKDAPFMGFFAYGNREGEIYGETVMVESDTKCPFDVIHTATHEIGGHYFENAKRHLWTLETEDLFGAVGSMASNEAVQNEGYANCAAEIFAEDLPYLFEKVGFGLEKMSRDELERNLKISNMLELLAMVSLGYEAARYFDAKDVDEEGMKQEYIEFGCDPHRAESRAKHMVHGRNLVHPYCYTGPGYYPGQEIVSRVINKYGPQGAIDRIVTDLGPSSLSTLNPIN